MNKEDIIKIIVSLKIESSFSGWDVEDAIAKLDLSDTIAHCSGACKHCLIFKQEDFVIKWCNSRYKNEAVEECEIYKKAKEKNLQFLFPLTYILCSVNGIDFVYQEKIDCSCAELTRESRKNYLIITKTVTNKIVFKMKKGFDLNMGFDKPLNVLWAKMVISLYGKKIAKNLCDFIQENKINDLHDYNIGYKNNRPILLDFSGYHR